MDEGINHGAHHRQELDTTGSYEFFVYEQQLHITGGGGATAPANDGFWVPTAREPVVDNAISVSATWAAGDLGPDFTELPDDIGTMLLALDDADEATSGSNRHNGLTAANTVSHAAAAAIVAGVENDVHPRGPSSPRGRRRMSTRRRRRSVVWEHMDLDPSGNEASCRYCTKKLSANSKSGTTHLRRHVNKCVLRELARLMDI